MASEEITSKAVYDDKENIHVKITSLRSPITGVHVACGRFACVSPTRKHNAICLICLIFSCYKMRCHRLAAFDFPSKCFFVRRLSAVYEREVGIMQNVTSCARHKLSDIFLIFTGVDTVISITEMKLGGERIIQRKGNGRSRQSSFYISNEINNICHLSQCS